MKQEKNLQELIQDTETTICKLDEKQKDASKRITEILSAQRFVVVADMNKPGVDNDKMVYQVCSEDEKAVVGFFGAGKTQYFGSKRNAENVASGFSVQNNLGKIKWYVVTEEAYLVHLVMDLQKSIDTMVTVLEQLKASK